MSTHDRNVLATLFFAVFATVIGVGMVVPLLPVHAHHMGARGMAIGLLFASFGLSRTLFLPLFGRLSDRKGRKSLIVPGLLAYALISVSLAFVTDVRGLIAVRFLHGVASAMLMPVIQAYVGDLAPEGREGRILGLHGTFVLTGMSIGPLVGGLVNDRYGIQFAFLGMGALAFIGFLLCATLLPPVRKERAARTQREPTPWKEILRDPHVAGLLAFRFSYVVCIGMIWGFVPLYAALKLSLSSASIGTVITLGILGSGAINTPMGILADRVDKRGMVIVGGLLAAAGMFAFGGAGGYRDMAMASMLFGVGGGVCMPALMAMAARKGHRSVAMGSVMALMTVAHSAGMLVGALLGGVIMDLFALHLVFPAGAAIMFVGGCAFVTSNVIATRASARAKTANPDLLSIDPALARR